MFKRNSKKIPWYIWCVCYKVLLLHPLSRTGAAMFWHSDRNGVGTLTYFFCLGLVSFWNSPLKKQNEKKLPKTFGRYKIKFLPLHPLSKSKQRWFTLFLESGSVKRIFSLFFLSQERWREKGKMKKNFRKYLEDILKSFYLCIRFPEKKADIKEAIFEEIYINNTSSTRARLVSEKETVLGKIKRTVIT